MTEEEFWGLVEAAKRGADGIDGRPQALRRLLDERSPSEIAAFYELYIDRIEQAYTWALWGAAYVIKGGCSDDGFDYFRDWLVSEGRAIYERALQDPESLAELPAVEDPELELYRYVAGEAYEQKVGQPMDCRDRAYVDDPVGEAWDEDAVVQSYPELAKRYW